MTPSELRGRSDEFASRVTRECGLAVGVVALVSAWLGGLAGALGALAGGAVALVNFRWLARMGVTAFLGRPSVAASMLASGVRLVVTFAALAAVLASGWAHPLALMAGLAVLPWSVVARGLAASRQQPESR